MKLDLVLSLPCWKSPFVSLPPFHPPSSLSSSSILRSRSIVKASTAESTANVGELSPRERRQLRNERREMKAYDWKDEVEERLSRRRKKKPQSAWMEELNLDNLARVGPQWWVIRVSRLSGQEAAEQLARGIARNFPNMDFKVYVPAVHIKKKLKNGTFSVKEKSLFPGCIFFQCVLNKELHDFVREWNGVGGFLGSKVGNSKRQINRPKPVPAEDMEAIFQQAKEEQEEIDCSFAQEHQLKEITDDGESVIPPIREKTTGRSRKSSKASKLGNHEGPEQLNADPIVQEGIKLPDIGSSVKVASGAFAEFTGCLRGFNIETQKATVAFMLFGKETLVTFDIDELIA